MLFTTAVLALAALTSSVQGVSIPRQANGTINKRAVPAPPSYGTNVNGWLASGCVQDTNSHILNFQYRSSSNTWELCQASCRNSGYNYAGVEAGTDCYCGNSLNSNGANFVADSYCNMACPGNSGENCGGTLTTVIFQYNGGTTTSSANAASASAASASAASASAASASAASASAASASKASASAASASAASASAASASAAFASAASASAASASAASASAASASAASASKASASAASASAASASAASASAASASAASASAASASAASASAANAAAASASAASASAASASAASASAASASAANANASASRASASAASASAASASAAAASASAANASAASASAASASAASASAANASAASASAASASAASASAAAASASAANASAASASVASASAAAAASASAASASAASASAAAASAASASIASASAASASAAAASASVASASAASASAASASAASASAAASVSAASASAASASASVASASAAAASASAAAAAQATTLPTGWAATSTPCVAEGTSGRALSDASYSAPNMTWNSCSSFCNAKGYTLAGVEYSSECYCGNVLSNGASLNSPSSQCNMQCSGANAICGGPGALTLFVSNAALSTLSADLTSKTVALPSGWSAATVPCIAEGTSGRALASASTSSSDMTVPKCLAYCGALGWQYAGVEYGSECYCGDQLVNGASLSRTATCNMHCSGDQATYCGAGNALQLYQNPSLALPATVISGYAAQGCIQEVSGRALTGASTSAPTMTIEVCTAFCAAGGFTYAGVEYGQECYCGNSLVNGASVSSVSTQCGMQCAGNSAEICGGPNAINLYKAQS